MLLVNKMAYRSTSVFSPGRGDCQAERVWSKLTDDALMFNRLNSHEAHHER